MKATTLLLMTIGLALSNNSFSEAEINHAQLVESFSDETALSVLPEGDQVLAAPSEISDATKSVKPTVVSSHNALTASGLNPSRSIGKVALALIFVVGVILAAAAILKRSGLSPLNRGKQLVLRESLSVGSKERLVVVDFAGESLLIGVASGKVNLVKSVPLLGVDNSSLPAAHLGARNPLDFQHKLNEFLLKGQK